MPYARNQGIEIRYEVEGEGPPLVLQHGLGGILGSWYLIGYVDALKDNYQLILIDARGHGASGKPHDAEAYRFVHRAADVVAVLDDLGLDKAYYLGYSMGGAIGWALAQYHPERFRSLMIGGFSPDGDLPGDEELAEPFTHGVDEFLAWLKSLVGDAYTPEVEAAYRGSDLEALACAAAHRRLWDEIDFQALLPDITLPCLVYGGEMDGLFSGAEACCRQMPNATFVSFPGMDHLDVLFGTDLVRPEVRTFLERVGELRCRYWGRWTRSPGDPAGGFCVGGEDRQQRMGKGTNRAGTGRATDSLLSPFVVVFSSWPGTEARAYG